MQVRIEAVLLLHLLLHLLQQFWRNITPTTLLNGATHSGIITTLIQIVIPVVTSTSTSVPICPTLPYPLSPLFTDLSLCNATSTNFVLEGIADFDLRHTKAVDFFSLAVLPAMETTWYRGWYNNSSSELKNDRKGNVKNVKTGVQVRVTNLR